MNLVERALFKPLCSTVGKTIDFLRFYPEVDVLALSLLVDARLQPFILKPEITGVSVSPSPLKGFNKH